MRNTDCFGSFLVSAWVTLCLFHLFVALVNIDHNIVKNALIIKKAINYYSAVDYYRSSQINTVTGNHTQ